MQNLVVKLINIYLSEKNIPEDLDKNQKIATSIVEGKSSIGKPILKDIEKKKEKNKPKDVWFFLEENEGSNEKEEDSLEKGCKITSNKTKENK